MLRIVTHIEQLLLMHDCIIIPKFGGFVLQTISTSYDKEESLFSPMRKEVVFNVTLQHNDGLLLESYMQKYEVDCRKAQLMLDEDVDALKSILMNDRKVSLGCVGSFVLGNEGQIVFYSNEMQNFSLESYGLSAFHFPLLSVSEQNEASLYEIGKVAVHQKNSHRVWRIVAASAAAVALFFVVSTPVKEVNQSAYTASFIPTEMVTARVSSAEPQLKKQEVVVEKKVAEKLAAVTPRIVKETKKAVADIPKAQPTVQQVTSKATKTFHIVIASFPTESQANEFLSGVDRSVCRNVNKIASKGKYRVYADKYNNREEAEAYLAKLRRNPKYKDAWLFITH